MSCYPMDIITRKRMKFTVQEQILNKGRLEDSERCLGKVINGT